MVRAPSMTDLTSMALLDDAIEAAGGLDVAEALLDRGERAAAEQVRHVHGVPGGAPALGQVGHAGREPLDVVEQDDGLGSHGPTLGASADTVPAAEDDAGVVAQG